MNISENTHIVSAFGPQAGGSAIAGDYISLKNASHVTVLVHVTQGNASTVALTLEQATAVAGTGSKAITEAVPIYLVADADTSDVWVRQTDAVSYTTSAALKTKLVAFEVDVNTLDTNGGFDCLCVKAAASNAANILSAQYIVTGERYHNTSMIVD